MADQYSGETKNGRRHGKGILYTGADCRLHGEWDNGVLIRGQGSIEGRSKKGVLIREIGTFENGELQGRGQRLFLDGNLKGNRLEGNFFKGAAQGVGSYIFSDGSKFVGEYVNGLRQGNGTLHSGSCCQLHGEWANNVMIRGQGSYEYRHTEGFYVRDEGSFEKGLLNGIGKRYIISGELHGCQYQGAFLNGALHGLCTFYHRDRSKAVSEYVNGVLHGTQRVYGIFGVLQYNTQWRNGQEIGPRRKGIIKAIGDSAGSRGDVGRSISNWKKASEAFNDSMDVTLSEHEALLRKIERNTRK